MSQRPGCGPTAADANSWSCIDRAPSLSATVDHPRMNRRCGRDKTADCSRIWLMRGLRRVKDRLLHRNWRERCTANNADDSTDAAPAIVRLTNWTRARMIRVAMRPASRTARRDCSNVAGCFPVFCAYHCAEIQRMLAGHFCGHSANRAWLLRGWRPYL